jgi:hypothetical protein
MFSPGATREPVTPFKRHLHSRLTGLLTYLLMGVVLLILALLGGSALGFGIAYALGLQQPLLAAFVLSCAGLLAIAAITFSIRDYRRRVGLEVRLTSNRVEIDLESGVRAVSFDDVDLPRIDWDRWGTGASLDIPVRSGPTLSIPTEQYPVDAIAAALKERLHPRAVHELAESALDAPVSFGYDRAALLRGIAGSAAWGLGWLVLGVWLLARWNWARVSYETYLGIGIAIISVVASGYSTFVNAVLLRVPPVVVSADGLRIGAAELVPWTRIARVEAGSRGLVLTRTEGGLLLLPMVYPKFALLADLVRRLAAKRKAS